MIEVQAATATASEPLLINAIAVGAGALILWAAHALLEVRDGVKSLTAAIFGDPNSKEDDGIKSDVTETKRLSESNTRAVEDHITEEMQWRRDNATNTNTQNNRLHKQLSRIERKLGIEDDL